jgi:hypothetical protein
VPVIISSSAGVILKLLLPAYVHKAGKQLARYRRINVEGRVFFYDVHKSANGILSLSIEVLPHRKTPYRLPPSGVRRMGKDAVLISHSGFCFAKYPQAEAEVEDHIFYLGRKTRGVELITFGRTKRKLLRRSTSLVQRLGYVWQNS